MAQKFVTPVTIRNLTSASSDGLAVSVDGDTNDRIKVEAGGRLVWGSGSATGDANLYRSGVGAVKTDHTFEAESGVITLTSSGAPTSTIADGAIAVDTTNSKFYYRSNSAWNTISGGATVSTTAPSNPSEGDIWFDSNTGDTLVYYGSVWVDVGGSSVANIAVQTTAPSNPVNGDLWFDTDTAKTYVWYDDGTSAQWVEVGAASAAASGTDGAIQFASGGTFSSDASNLVWDDANNRLGIGTTTPVQALDVAGNIRLTGEIDGPSDFTVSNGQGEAIQFSQTDNATYLKSVGATRLTINSSGNVGIGTTTPAVDLQIGETGSGSNAYLDLVSDAGRITTLRASDAGNFCWVGTETNHNFSISTNGSRHVTVDTSGNVGIGTTSPGKELDVHGAGTVEARLLSTDGGDTALLFGDSVDSVRASVAYVTSQDRLDLRGYNNSTRMSINSSGNVGIGTTSPSAPLEISTSVNTEALRLSANFTAGNQETYITAVDTGDSSILAAIGLGSTGGSNDNDGAITFRTTTASSSSIPAAKVTISRDGNVGIGTESPSRPLDVATGGARFTGYVTISSYLSIARSGGSGNTLVVQNSSPVGSGVVRGAQIELGPDGNEDYTDSGDDFIRFITSNNQEIGGIRGTGAASVSYGTTSDYRLKAPIEEISDGLSLVRNLAPMYGKWLNQNDPNRIYSYFIAHELQEHIPDAVDGAKDAVDEEGQPDYQSVDYGKLTPVLTAAIKDLDALVGALTARIEALEAN